jgi:type I restriction enzyme R subunit
MNKTMAKDFNEDTLVKIPAILTLTRLGYGYLSHKKRTDIDRETNIFKTIFFDSIQRINPEVEPSTNINKSFLKIQTCLDDDDLGREFYGLLTASSGLKLNPQMETNL